jgi:integrase
MPVLGFDTELVKDYLLLFSLHRLRNVKFIFRVPETAKGRRVVSLSPSTTLMLKDYKNKKYKERLVLGRLLGEDDLIFSDIEGKPLLPDAISHAWAKLTKRIGLEGVRLHDARHSHASLLLKQGVHQRLSRKDWAMPPSQQPLIFMAT